MNETELAAFRERLSELAVTGTETQVRAYIDEQFPRLPEEMQNDIVMGMFTTSVQDEARELEAIGKIQQEGLAAAGELEKIKAEISERPENS